MTTSDIVKLLNQLLDADQRAINELFHLHVECDHSLISHPLIELIQQEQFKSVGIPAQPKDTNCRYPYALRILGLLNGIAALERETIEAVYANDGNISFFRVQTQARRITTK